MGQRSEARAAPILRWADGDRDLWEESGGPRFGLPCRGPSQVALQDFLGCDDGVNRRDDGVNLDDLLLDAGDDTLDVLAEPGVVLLLAIPNLGDREAATVVHESDVVLEARGCLQLLDQRRRGLVVLLRRHIGDPVSDKTCHDFLVSLVTDTLSVMSREVC